MNDLVLVAKLGRTHALMGAMFLHNLSDFEEQFKPGARFVIKGNRELEISSYDPAKSIVKFKGINSVDEAKKLVNMQLFSTKERTREQFGLADGEHFYFDVIGLEALEGELLLGKVVDIFDQGANFLLEIATNEELIKSQLELDQKAAASKPQYSKRANKKPQTPKPLSKTFYIPYVDAYVDSISDKVYAKGAFELLKHS